MASDSTVRELYRKHITGSHILHYQGVLDAYGHLSFRHPTRPDVFVMSQFIAPALVSSEEDLIEYWVKDASPVDPTAGRGYSERCIHSEVYRRYPGVQSVIHSHSEDVVPYTISGVPLHACCHVGGFLDHLRPSDQRDMLVRNTHLGGALASYFSAPESTKPEHAVVLMRGHGFTVQAESIEECVVRAVYTRKNASVQTTTLLTRAAYEATQPSAELPAIKYLDDDEVQGTNLMTKESAYRPWGLWVKEVEGHHLYMNKIK
ncbi:hypothetical protein ASPZODRAFT_149670 [Penicilliopsis zonata CBS 506.65]|uniref:Class II aldolase/adducin N-terminal domain-containing protein n=1 Tax=Penicilliopsis zonata CBS 506.65 TaxID=1073090 RepID=A0A1L9SSX8_9EURO|nr:hypothetical protein ASPZODRAFT_149670 [Penicilliopsis zonata CBS 506.65]OJJ50312.1 hypothetical protein ASPZODRAFT_149670 [Penicilliopsis zonata CBS 506.65]